jgi:Rrf2 family protein
MLLSQTAQYALRALARIAALPPASAATAKDISAETGVPPHYLSKILRMLVEAGLLESEKGHHGGFRLNRPAVRITVADVLDAVHESVESQHCAFGYARCNDKAPCPLHPVFSKLNDSVREWASRSTLADVGLDLPHRTRAAQG